MIQIYCKRGYELSPTSLHPTENEEVFLDAPLSQLWALSNFLGEERHPSFFRMFVL